MNSKMFRKLALGLVALLAFAAVASAQEPVFRGSFTLSADTRWGLATLPKGDYSFKLDNATHPAVVTVRGNGTVAMIHAQALDHPISDNNELVLVRSGDKAEVRSMTIADVGTFYYPRGKGEPPFVARAPQIIQRVPIKLLGK